MTWCLEPHLILCPIEMYYVLLQIFSPNLNHPSRICLLIHYPNTDITCIIYDNEIGKIGAKIALIMLDKPVHRDKTGWIVIGVLYRKNWIFDDHAQLHLFSITFFDTVITIDWKCQKKLQLSVPVGFCRNTSLNQPWKKDTISLWN